MNPVKNLFLIVIALSTAGCGTLNTVFREDAVASQNLKDLRSHCENVPRVYSGVVYDFCSLNGEPNSNGNMAAQHVNSVPWVAIDFVASGVLDTLVLPYTIYRQSKDGSIEIFR
ncbi:YceK/YidQ family lipoprotein [Pseudomonas sp. ADAK18]|uniref:YceK/YidQ family lipoprotein n=1 Tax=Pseudomonas sp. ADAK18 TaxID=2730848 RepID=UPI001464A629|nr:YceK/YidQ family lipoprotein [Pseudomonas sp. ADAK18]QJI32398.1 YceK/YidQ family lipoprotein [Pseudomonas sp. ADAK18]